MRLAPHTKQEWAELLLFPFKAYLALGFLGYIVWGVITKAERGPFARGEAAWPVILGYALCAATFTAAAFLHGYQGRRELVAEHIILTLVAVLIGLAVGWSAAG